MKATILDIETTITKVNTVLVHDTSWDMQTAFTALIEQFEKFDNIYLSFESEVFTIANTFDFCIELEEGTQDFTVFQMFEDIRKFSLEY